MKALKPILVLFIIFIGIVTSAGSINYGYTQDEPFYIVVAILNFLSLGYLVYKLSKNKQII